MSSSTSTSTPYLTVVAASRNDDHGGDPLRRTQIFINCFAQQCEKYQIPAELILVDWNPVAGRKGLAEALTVPDGICYCSFRIITVPKEIHDRIKYSEKLPFFQMIAKNVGIRRAHGKFVLATNIDIIFSDELMAFIGRQQLDPRHLYRVDRCDIESGLSEHLTLDETLAYAWKNPIRTHKRMGPKHLIKHLYPDDELARQCSPSVHECSKIGGFSVQSEDGVWQVEAERGMTIENLHTNACGDFTLLAKDAWEDIRGYPEFEAFSMNIDSIGMAAAHYAGYTEKALLPPLVCFHIEHSLGSGWTAEGEAKLFQRLREANILNPEWPVILPLVEQMRTQQRALDFNHSDWGFASFALPETTVGNHAQELDGESITRLATTSGAIQPKYDFDRLTLKYERKLLATAAYDRPGDARSIVQLFIPDSTGEYSEEMCMVYSGTLSQFQRIVFNVGAYASEFPLRLDPCASAGIIEIKSITFLDLQTNQVMKRIDDSCLNELQVGGSASLFTLNDHLITTESKGSVYIKSYEDDPQLYLPPFKSEQNPQIMLLIEMRVIPNLVGEYAKPPIA